MNRILILSLSFIVFSSCYNDNEEDLYGIDCRTESLTYAINLEKVINESCATAGCHEANGQYVDYTNYNNIIADTGIIFERSIVQKDMPPNSAMSDCNFKLLQSWIEQGAKE